MSRTAPDADRATPKEPVWELPREGKCSTGFRYCKGRGELKRDPFDYEIADRTVYRYLCDSCEQRFAYHI